MPDESTATDSPVAVAEVPPKFLAHTRSPEESNFKTNASLEPCGVRLVVPAPGSKSAVPEKDPVVYTLPDESTATELPNSPLLLLPPKLLAHARFPDESNFNTNTSEPPFMVRLVVPAPGSKSTVSE